jgi:hypothetical protein
VAQAGQVAVGVVGVNGSKDAVGYHVPKLQEHIPGKETHRL